MYMALSLDIYINYIHLLLYISSICTAGKINNGESSRSYRHRYIDMLIIISVNAQYFDCIAKVLNESHILFQVSV